MQKSFWLTIWGIAIAGVAWGQIKKQFTIENTQACESISLRLKANNGNCYIKPSQNVEILNVFSNQDESAYSHTYKREIKGKTCEVYLSLEEAQAESISETLSTRMFGTSERASSKLWKMYLTDSKPYFLELNYAIGNANVDLSGLAIKNLKINTGSADVNIGYYSLLSNQVDMDTFSIKVDLGSLNVKNLNLSRARYMIADVGFGNMTLDFSGPTLVDNTVKGSVGAGNLVIILPQDDTPVLIKIHDSWLCSVKFPQSLKKIKDNMFANASYKKDARNALTFDLDVSMGSIIFKESAAK